MSRRQKAIALIVLALCAAIFIFLFPRSPRPKAARPRPLDPEYAKLAGNWEFVSMEVEGSQKPEHEYKKYLVVLTNDQWLVFAGTNIKAQTAMELDPAVEPKTIDLFPAGEARVIQGIYKLENDRFTMCDRGSDRGERPAAFETKPDSGLVLVVLKRIK